MKKISITIIFTITIFSTNIFAQDSSNKRLAAITDVSIKGYRNINIGMSKNEVIDIIKNDPLMVLEKKYYNTNIDLSSEETKNIVVLVPNKYFKSGYFLFKDEKLYSIIISFQNNQTDFLEILEALNKKYTKGSFINAGTVSWESGGVKLTLERPATIKYTVKQENTDNTVNEDDATRKSLFEGL